MNNSHNSHNYRFIYNYNNNNYEILVDSNRNKIYNDASRKDCFICGRSLLKECVTCAKWNCIEIKLQESNQNVNLYFHLDKLPSMIDNNINLCEIIASRNEEESEVNNIKYHHLPNEVLEVISSYVEIKGEIQSICPLVQGECFHTYHTHCLEEMYTHNHGLNANIPAPWANRLTILSECTNYTNDDNDTHEFVAQSTDEINKIVIRKITNFD